MKELRTNLYFFIIGLFLVVIQITFEYEGILGLLLFFGGFIMIIISLFYKSKKPIEFALQILEFIVDIVFSLMSH